MKFKKILLPLTALTLTATLTACSSTTTSTNSNKTEQKANDSATVKLNTAKGEIEVVKNPKNVAIFDLAALDLVQRYDVKIDNLVTAKINAPYLEKVVSGKDKAGTLREPNYEFLSTFRSDVIFTTLRQAEFYEELNKVGKTAEFTVDSKDYFNSMIKLNTEIAKVFGVEAKVNEDKEKFEKTIKEVSEKAKASGKKALIILTNEGKITAFGPNSRFGYIHTLFGFEAVDKDIKESRHGSEINYEYISKVNPDIIFYVDRNSVIKSKTNSSATTTLDNELVKGTNAGKNGEIYEIEAQYAYLSDGGLTGFEKISEVLQKAVNK